MSLDLEVFETPGLGDASYLLRSGSEAVLVDPQRDVGRMLRALSGARLAFVLETHVHNDYLSGGLEARAATGAEVAVPEAGGHRFPHLPLVDGMELAIGDLLIQVVAAAGHTPEHTAYLVCEAASRRPLALFTGGSLIVGGAGRTDLLGAERAEELARQQFRTLRRLTELPDDVLVLPTHGAGSFCTAGGSDERTSTLGVERERNAVLAIADEDEFVERQLTGLPLYPSYYAHMAPLNREGPRPLSELPPLRALSPGAVAGLMGEGFTLVDLRDRVAFAAEHIPGSLNVEQRSDFASYVGWLVPWGAPFALVPAGPGDASLADARMSLARIGYEEPAGYLAGGITAWKAEGLEVRSYPSADIADLCGAVAGGAPVLDVRQRTEWDGGHISGSTHSFVVDLARSLRNGEPPVGGDGETWVICATGFRAAMAASLLDASGVPVRVVAHGGVSDFLRDCGDGSPAPNGP